uniref:Ig-like domain-containing protein n=1 Tax=Lates calcarifer TaxID=8187 RepID=A0A4W6ESX3_LATCA
MDVLDAPQSTKIPSRTSSVSLQSLQIVQPGQSLTITCQVSGYSLTDNSYATGWIRQHEGKPMDWIFHMWGGGGFYQNNALKNKFSYNRDTSTRTVTLTGQNLQPEDTAVYYCVRCPTGSQVVCFTVTIQLLHKLNITLIHNFILMLCIS